MDDGVSNLFVHRSAARRYATARPFFHPLAVEKIAGFTGSPRVERALDVACGTGQSARALLAIADQVEAIDVSPEMVAEAEPHPRIHYQVARAEELPFDGASFDLATVGLAFHWFDQGAFLRQARRVLKPGRWLAVYNSAFTGEMVESPGFRKWMSEAHLKHFPTPPRRSSGVTAELVTPHGFELSGQEIFEHPEPMTAEQLTAYLLTQTNVIAAVENGATPLPEAEAWIREGVTPFFTNQLGTMKFAAALWYLRPGA
jgi:SAM-dependent methyltransferase